ncbi:carbon-nitrogen hydrolase family protein [Chondrinema litorale]|uniref:carbon-nitrogen hydrolase family protein n=1 Tax=Chondrinema litorale TaxID=2994555 RepID=UPI00254277FA|nr:carbon-nitrogen hydrolase family protein [Chondrinema litorale]UZR94868.1 carbon-nitrogen hydrolase family protein [Chondrinema litorale]
MKIKKKYKAAVVQAAPVLFNKDACVQKIIKLSKEAAAQGASLVVFPESFIPAYPRGLSFGTVVGSRTESGRYVWLRYFENSIDAYGDEMHLLQEAAKELGIFLVVGITEKDMQSGGTLYCSMVFIDASGKLLGVHRKLKPTGAERIIWGEGDGSSLKVYDTELGKIGGLICWENYMPLSRMALYQQGVQVYIAPTADARETWQATMQHIACEGRYFVLGCNQFVKKDMYPTEYLVELSNQPEIMCKGGSSIYHPLGKVLVEPVYNEEKIILTEIDLDECTKAKMDFDVTGHYHRPDVFKFSYTKPAE